MQKQSVTVEKKPWWQSKIVALGAVMVLIFGGNYLTGFVTTQMGVTPEQIQAVEAVEPQVVDVIDRISAGENILSLVGAIMGILITVARVWFTPSVIAQSLPKARGEIER